MLIKFNMLSINHYNAQIKLNEIWKSVNFPIYPIKTLQLESLKNEMQTRARTTGLLKQAKVNNLSGRIFINANLVNFEVYLKVPIFFFVKMTPT